MTRLADTPHSQGTGSHLGIVAQVLLVAVLCAPAIAYACIGEFKSADEPWIALAAGVLGGLCIACVLVLDWRTGWWLTFLMAPLAVLHFAYLATFRWPLDANALALLGETNFRDALEMVSGVPLLAFAPFALTAALSMISWPRVDLRRWRPAALRVLGVCLLGLGVTYATVRMATDLDVRFERTLDFPPPVHNQALAWRGGFPGGFPWVLSDLIREQRALRRAAAYNRGFRFGAVDTHDGPRRRVFVLVIGEAARGDHWQLNGYPRETTPLLSERTDVTSFSRMYSPWAFSRLAVPLMITRKDEASTSALFEEASIVRAFGEAGFETLWISLKPALGMHASPVSVHAAEADQVVYLNKTDKGSHALRDTAAVPVFRERVDATTRDLFVVVHTIGSHFDYSRRYARDDAVFLPDRPTGRPLRLFDRNDKALLVNAYDNSLRETDRLLAGLIEALDGLPSTESWLLYSSDHGEALFDGCIPGRSGHGHVQFETQTAAAVFWASRAYRERAPRRVAQLKAHADAPLGISMLFETLAHLGDLSVPGARAGHSIAAPDLVDAPAARTAEADRATCKG